MNFPVLANQLTRVTHRSTRTQPMPDPDPHCRMTAIIETAAFTICSTAGGLLMAANSQTDFGVIIGGALAGAGIAGMLGAILAGTVKDMEIPRMTGLKRLATNFLFGILTIPVIPKIHRAWAPDEDLAMVAAGTAAAAALFGVVIFNIALPVLLRTVRVKASLLEPQEPRMLITDRRPTATDTSNTDTVILAPPVKPRKPESET